MSSWGVRPGVEALDDEVVVLETDDDEVREEPPRVVVRQLRLLFVSVSQSSGFNVRIRCENARCRSLSFEANH